MNPEFAWLCWSCGDGFGAYLCGAVARDGICAFCGSLATDVYTPEVLEPHHLTPGVTLSTCGTLAVWRPIVWDVNGYYLELGVPTDATRLQIRRAYQDLGGHGSPRLTYIVKQLLDPEIRAAYDATPLGRLFFDRYVEEYVRRKIAEDTAGLAGTDPDLLSTEQIDLSHLRNRPAPTIGGSSAQVVDDYLEPGYGALNHWPRGWLSWRWKTPGSTSRLAEWLHLLLGALPNFGDRKDTRFALGLYRGSDEYRIEVLERTPVIWFDVDLPPSESVCLRALADLLAHSPHQLQEAR